MTTHHRTVRLTGNVLRITQDGTAQDYHLTRIPCDDGEGWHLDKLDENGHVLAEYDVNLYPSNGHHACDCAGGTYRGSCRHISSLVALHRAGRLSRPVCTARAS